MSLTLGAIRHAISKIEGGLGSTVSSAALHDLTFLCAEVGTEDDEQIDFVDELDKEATQEMFVSEIDAAVAELILFRELMVGAMNDNKAEIDDAKCTPLDSSLYRAIKPMFTDLKE